MRALGGQRPHGRRAPAPEPSRWARRAQRLWRRRSFRRTVTVQAPALALVALAAWLAYSPVAHRHVAQRLQAAQAALTQRPEFAISRIEVLGATPAVEAEIRASLFDVMGASSLALDEGVVQRRVETLGWVSRARVSLDAPVGLRIAVDQREAAAVWRIEGQPVLVDATGAVIEPAFSRADYPALPLIAGPGADRAVAQALDIYAAAGPLLGRVRGLVRVGQRRWDVLLTGPARDETMRLMLPERDAVAVMAQAVGAQAAHRLFDRDIAVVDLRLPARPTVRLTGRALQAAPDAAAQEDEA